MEFNITIEKKNRPSFWEKLFKPTKKDDSKQKTTNNFSGRYSLYNSFRHSKEHPKSEENEEQNFTTIEGKDFEEMHKDAGIIFINKNPISKNILLKEEDKHVQFAPTPMNKCYKVDMKAPIVKKDKANKENVSDQSENLKPARSILRLTKSRDGLNEAVTPLGLRNGNAELVNVTYIDGPELKKTPTIPRTSTRLALIDHKNGLLPPLNVSNITKYGSLPRPSSVDREKRRSEMVYSSALSSNSNEVGKLNSNNLQFSKNEFIRQSMRMRTAQPAYFSVQDLSKYTANKNLQEQNQNIMHTFNFKKPQMPHPKVKHYIERHAMEVKQSELEANHPIHKKSGDTRNINSNQGWLPASTNAPIFHDLKIQVPNKKMNEIGLPIPVDNKHSRNINFRRLNKRRPRSESPHYIHLADTFSSKTLGTQNMLTNRKKTSNSQESRITHTISGIPEYNHRTYFDSKKPIKQMKSNTSVHKEIFIDSMTNEEHLMNQAKKLMLSKQKSDVYSQKRRYMNKICKYKSKEFEEGFSSMADDECSLNCSCNSCISKFSKIQNYNDVKVHPESKYFFTITPGNDLDNQFHEPEIPVLKVSEIKSESIVKECAALKCIPEINEEVIKSDYIIANDESKAENSTWYDCNDSLCKTPKNNKTDVEKQDLRSLSPQKLEVEKFFENVTKIINSTTKQNFKVEHVEKVFSTPVSNIKMSTKLALGNTGSKVSRALFTSNEKISDIAKQTTISPLKTPLVLNDSIVLLQEIFQKLSQECRELLQPNSSINGNEPLSEKDGSSNSGVKYITDIMKNLHSKEMNENDFANIIGDIAQSVFQEAKSKRKSKRKSHFSSLPDLRKDSFIQTPLRAVASLKDLRKTLYYEDTGDKNEKTNIGSGSTNKQHFNNSSYILKTQYCLKKGVSDHKNGKDNDSMTSESDTQLLENAIRLGMGLTPIKSAEIVSFYASSPAKVTKYKSRDVLSCKGKLKLRIYHNSGLVTVNVMRAAKLSRLCSKDINSYIKISMIPDETKRVHLRTSVLKNRKNPVFNQKFSFELLGEDVAKRLVFSVWHRDFSKSRSELIGCMSFSVQHILDNSHKIDGWYRLLREGFGIQKHFAAHGHKLLCALK